MAIPTYPGVYVEEVSSGVRPIQAAGTSTAAFIGIAEKGPLDKAVKIYNFTEYLNQFGGFLDSGKYLAHSVYQFFNNGGSQCYVIRVAGGNPQTASVELYDRGESTPAKSSLTISAVSPGIWGNRLAIEVTNGTNDSVNEFNLLVYNQDIETATPQDKTTATLLERFDNLSMVPGSPNFVKSIISASNQIQIQVNTTSDSFAKGTSRGSEKPSILTNANGNADKTKFRINLNGDGYQEVDLKDAVNLSPPPGSDQVNDLASPENIRDAIKYVVKKLTTLRAVTDQAAFTDFDCEIINGKLLLTSGVKGSTSSVSVAPTAKNEEKEDASKPLNLGRSYNGIETIGAAVTRPQVNNIVANVTQLYLLGRDISKQDPSGVRVISVHGGKMMELRLSLMMISLRL